MHAAIGALSQGIPTVMLAYGPKQYGIAEILGIKKYVCGSKDSKRILSTVKEAWKNRERLHRTLKETSARAKELANINFLIISDILRLSKENRNSIPEKISDKWIAMGAPSDNIEIDLIDKDIEIRH